MNGESAANDLGLPTVTIFGAGIAGLTAAHELVERGFPVQVVEQQPDDFAEYECAVGGLAANQFARVRAPLGEVHDRWLMDDKALLDQAERFRRGERKLQRTSKRFPIPHSIRFDRKIHDPRRAGQPRQDPPDYDTVRRTPYEPQDDIPGNWIDYWDNHGVTNRRKLGAVLETIRSAAHHYMALYFPLLFDRLALGAEPVDGEWTNFLSIHASVDQIKEFVAREILVVRIIGYTDTDGTAEDSRELANAWAQDVRQELIARNGEGPADLGVWRLEDHLDVVVVGSANPRYDQSDPVGRSQSNRVEFEIVEQVIPGEHGFRFFPTFYRHLFDTMRRTPMFDGNNKANGQTAFDQLASTPQAFLALEDGKGPQTVTTRQFKSLFALSETLKLVCEKVGFTPRDLLGLQYFTLRYLMSCPERREEAEGKSLLQYIGGDDPTKKRFSKAALNFIDRAPRALAAMSATESDARTQYDITVQLMVAPPAEGAIADMTLNGPTSPAWLDHWKKYLKLQGVKFFVGKLDALHLVKGHFIPAASGPEGWPYPHPCPEDAYDTFSSPGEDGAGLENHRFVLATSFQRASDLIWAVKDADRFVGPFRQLINFDIESGRRSREQPAAPEPRRDPTTGKEPLKYPLRTISGLQYIFPQQYRFGAGNVYFVSAPWALTSISQFAYWRQRVRPVGPFLGQISVDVGDWHAFYPPSTNGADGGHGNTAWYSSSQEIADNTWAQVKDGLAKAYADVVDPPTYFHIDRNIVFRETRRSGFVGSALLHISRPVEPHFDFALYALRFRLTDDKWGGSGGQPVTRELPFSQQWARGDAELTPDRLASAIKQRCGDYILALPYEIRDERAGARDKTGDERAGVLVSPKARRRRFVIAFRPAVRKAPEPSVAETRPGAVSARKRSSQQQGDRLEKRAPVSHDLLTESNFCIAVEDQPPWMVSFSEFHAHPSRALDTFRDNFPDLEVNRLHELHPTIELKRKDDHEFSVGVAHVNGAVEILDGPQLEVITGSNLIQIENTMHAPSGRITAAAVRANATVGVPSVRGNDAPNGLQAGRIYGIGLSVGAGATKKSIRHIAGSDDPAAVRTALLDQLRAEAADLVIAEPHDWNDKTGRDMKGIVMSPIAELPAVTINVLGRSDRDFLIVINGHALPKVSGRRQDQVQTRDQVQIRDEIVHVLKREATNTVTVTPIDEHGLSLQRVKDGPEFTIAVLNVDRKIELVGAPALTVEVKDLHLLQADDGFVVLRNDAELLINVPGQWKARPGLWRGDNASGMPATYPPLAGCFGNMDPEIYYGHPDGDSLEHWVSAGTYMATYTRMTTMEAANESGRHAAAALIYKCLHPPRLRERDTQGSGLAGDLPKIFKIEENELEDFKFYVDLDRELFKSNLPHVFDILSITELVNAVLESKLPDNEIRVLAQQSNRILDDLKLGLNLGVRASGQAFSHTIGLLAALVKKMLDETNREGVLSNLQREVLSLLHDKATELDKVYSDLWRRGG